MAGLKFRVLLDSKDKNEKSYKSWCMIKIVISQIEKGRLRVNAVYVDFIQFSQHDVQHVFTRAASLISITCSTISHVQQSSFAS